jgi:large subunit ribosomal protein L5
VGKEKQANAAEKIKVDKARGQAVQAQKAAAAGKGPAEREPDRKSDQKPMLNQQYQKTIVPALMKEFDYANVMEVPKVAKVVVNIGIGEAKDNDKALEAARGDVRTITGQQPVVIKSRKSVAAFKLRAGMPVGIRTTLRGRRMYYFLEKLINVALPRIRDFRGVSPEAFDGRGNYTLGLREQIIFPEVDYDKIDKLRGLEITLVTTAKTDEEGRSLLTQMGMPFRKREQR